MNFTVKLNVLVKFQRLFKVKIMNLPLILISNLNVLRCKCCVIPIIITFLVLDVGEPTFNSTAAREGKRTDDGGTGPDASKYYGNSLLPFGF